MRRFRGVGILFLSIFVPENNKDRENAESVVFKIKILKQ